MLLTIAALGAAVGLVAIPACAAASIVAAPAAAQPAEWREAFSPDGTITPVQVAERAEATAALTDVEATVAAQVTTLQNTGPSATRFDLVIVGDGYTASEMGLLGQRVTSNAPTGSGPIPGTVIASLFR
ncbi:hypothetical protein ACFVZH_36205 [Streptomyces sp. NPDC059534]|uniref:hypothetical protein n=1 Tax=Streptomyces sp. NPDC059534 TaxID=3346859 RepID=UPI0036928FF8